MRPLRCLPALALLLAATAALAQAPSEDEAAASHLAQERQRIAREREALLAGFQAEDQACRQRFFVNSCLGDLAVRRREALAPLREQEIRLEEGERQRRHDEAIARRAQKQTEAERTPEASAERLQLERAEREQSQAEREAQARQRAQQQVEREREAVRRQREREEAARARARRGEAAPLPAPSTLTQPR